MPKKKKGTANAIPFHFRNDLAVFGQFVLKFLQLIARYNRPSLSSISLPRLASSSTRNHKINRGPIFTQDSPRKGGQSIWRGIHL